MYLDPGFGGMLVQVLVAIVAVGGATVFTFKKRIKEFFTKKKSNDPNANVVETTEAEAEVEDAIDAMDDED